MTLMLNVNRGLTGSKMCFRALDEVLLWCTNWVQCRIWDICSTFVSGMIVREEGIGRTGSSMRLVLKTCRLMKGWNIANKPLLLIKWLEVKYLERNIMLKFYVPTKVFYFYNISDSNYPIQFSFHYPPICANHIYSHWSHTEFMNRIWG